MASLEELCALASEETLSLDIATAASRIPDTQTAQYLTTLSEHLGEGELGGLLSTSDANRLHQRMLRPSDRDAIEAQLRSFLAAPSPFAWRWKPRSTIKPPKLPEHRGRLEEWIIANDLDEILATPLPRLLPWLPERLHALFEPQPPAGTIGSLLRPPRGAAPAISRMSREAFEPVRRYVQYTALRRALADHREKLWEKRPDNSSLRRLSVRLKEALRELDVNYAEGPARMNGQEQLQVNIDPPGIGITFLGSRSEVDVEIGFEGFEEGALALQVENCPDQSRSPELRAALEWTLDAVHDPDHALHGALSRVLSRPTWTRLVEAIAPKEEEEAETVERVVWRISFGEEFRIVPAVQRKSRGNRWTKGAAWKLEDLAAHRHILEGPDEMVLDALLAADALEGSRRVRQERVVAQRARALSALVGHPRVQLSSGQSLQVKRTTPTVALVGDAAVAPEVRLGEQAIVLGHDDAQTLIHHDDEEGVLWLAAAEKRTAEILHTIGALAAKVPLEGQDSLLAALVAAQPGVQLQLPERLRGESRPTNNDPVVRLEGSEAGLRLEICARPVPGGGTWPAGEGPRMVVGVDGQTRVHTLRDHGAERAEAERLLEALGPSLQHEGTTHRVDGLEAALDVLARLENSDQNATLEWRGSGWRLDRAVGLGDLRVNVQRAGDLLGLEGVAQVDGAQVPLSVLLNAARSGARYVRIGPGRFARLADNLRKRLEDASDTLHVDRKGEVSTGLASAPELASILEGTGAVEGEWLQLVERAKNASTLEIPVSENFNGELRDYQHEGYRWLTRLASWGAGAVLADEMGLGKTVQATATLVHRAEEGPSLVVAPTSVGSVWANELARFAPSMRAMPYRGTKRAELLEDLKPGDVLITSYDIVARDSEILKEIEWGTLVLDEAQAVKNARTKRARAAGGLNAKWRLALSGTPLENHLGELWSILRVVSPGLLGTWENFRRRFALPIERDGDQHRRDALAARLRPFLLRRTKTRVAKELPARTEVLRPVELGDAERTIYDAARREALEELVGAKRFDVLAAITRLRLLACHPRLVDARSSANSAKMKSTLELIDELRREGHRALVFSQFTKHLALLREELDLRGIEHLYLDGTTPAKRRSSLVDQWQDGDAPLFLISLKAGGTGLNLTAADYVLHLDPWWNPAVEDQASDRAHRIGQQKPVTVVRLVAQNTIEESVVALHETKRQLADAILEGGAAAGRLSAEELVGLIEGA